VTGNQVGQRSGRPVTGNQVGLRSGWLAGDLQTSQMLCCAIAGCAIAECSVAGSAVAGCRMPNAGCRKF